MDDSFRLTTSEERQIYNQPSIPKIAGTYKGACRIVGGGASMWHDLELSEQIMPGTDIIAVAVAGMVIPNVQHLFSWHKKQISAIKEWRLAEWPDCKAVVHSVQRHGRVDVEWTFDGACSTSGLSAVDLAWLLGYRKIALVGVPMDNSGYFYKPFDNPDLHDAPRLMEIETVKGRYKDIVRSFSGNTAKVFGLPSKEWLWP